MQRASLQVVTAPWQVAQLDGALLQPTPGHGPGHTRAATGVLQEQLQQAQTRAEVAETKLMEV